MTNLIAYDNDGNKIQLIQLILHDKPVKGGEGKIYCIQGNDEECAKIYLQEKNTKERHEKILAMVNNLPNSKNNPIWSTIKHSSIAWPNRVLYRDSEKTKFIGFKMPFMDTKFFQKANVYFDRRDRLKLFRGDFTWLHMFTVAYNIISTIVAVHYKGHSVGDLQPDNILVAPDALITLIDCDSFQIRDTISGRVFYSRVGLGEYRPPELMYVDFKEDYNRYYSDLFALGILIFRFLMLGFHPYQARGSLVEDATSTEAKINKGYFAYSGRYKDAKPPHGAPPYDIIPLPIQKLFNKCFVDGHKSPTKRPTAKEWLNTLKPFHEDLKQCPTYRTCDNSNHFYFRHLSRCPWCEYIKKYNKNPFPPNKEYVKSILDELGSELNRLEITKANN